MSCYLPHNKIKEWTKEKIIEKLPDLEGATTSQSEIVFDLFHHDIFETDCEAEEFIKEYFGELKEVLEEIKDNGFDNDFICKLMFDLLFDNQAQAMSFVIREIAGNIFYRCKSLDDSITLVNDITLTEEVIEKLIEELKEV